MTGLRRSARWTAGACAARALWLGGSFASSGGGGGGGGILPTVPAGGVMWLAPGIGQTTSGSPAVITAWTDHFGLGNGVTSSGSGVRFNTIPIGSNGVATVGNTLNTDFFVGPNIATMMAGASSAEIFMVMMGLNNGSTHVWTNGWGGTPGDFFRFSDGNTYDDFCSSARLPGFALGNDGPVVYNAISDVTSWTANVNGSQVYTRASNTVTFKNAALNLWGSGGGWQGTCGEVIVYACSGAGGIGSTNRAGIVTYLRSKWGF